MPSTKIYCADCGGVCQCQNLPIQGLPQSYVKSGGNLTIVGKRLTDRRISKYKKQGYYGSGILALQRKEIVAKKKHKSKPLKLSSFL